jgi:hypothetical protein
MTRVGANAGRVWQVGHPGKNAHGAGTVLAAHQGGVPITASA